MNEQMQGNYNHEGEGVLTTEFMSKTLKEKNYPKYITIKGYYNVPNALTFDDVLNHMFQEEKYKFVIFVYKLDERNTYGELLFERIK